MRRPRLWIVLLSILLIASLVGNGMLFGIVKQQYRSNMRVRLDPSSEERFSKLNLELPPLKGGEKRVIFAGASRMDMWQKLPQVNGCQMVNRGNSHDTSAQLRLRLQRDILDLKPDVVFLEVGVNDLKSIGVLPDQEQLIVDRLRTNREFLMKELTDAGVHVIVSTIFPFGDVPLHRRPFWSDRTLHRREEINREIRELKGPQITVFDADPLFLADGRMKKEFQLDEFHLNDAAYETLNQAVAPVIDAIVRPE